MSALRRSTVVVLTLFLTAVFSSFAWSADTQPHAFRAEVSGRGRPMILIPGLHRPANMEVHRARYRTVTSVTC